MIFDTYPWFTDRPLSESGQSSYELLSMRAEYIEEHFNSHVSGGTVFDMGCADGRWSAWAIANDATSVKGVDENSSYIDSANSTFAEHHGDATYSFEAMSYADVPTDIIYGCVLVFGFVHIVGLSAIDKATAITDKVLLDTAENSTCTKEEIIARFTVNNFSTSDYSNADRILVLATRNT